MIYNKPELTYDDQLDLLESRGLLVPDRQYALKLLSRINYYRLSVYFIPLQSSKDKFKPDVSIKDVKELYKFDHELRKLIFNALKVIEITLRTNLTYHLAHTYKPFGYLDSNNYASKFKRFNNLINDINDEANRSREDFVKHFKTTYPSSPGLPIWMVTELITFGKLSTMFSGLQRKDKQAISKIYKINENVFESWLHSLTYLRNICAHHARIWNRTIAIPPKIPHLWNNPISIPNDKVFSMLTIIHYLLKNINSEIAPNFKHELNDLFLKYQRIDLKAMGFIDKWEDHPIWKS